MRKTPSLAIAKNGKMSVDLITKYFPDLSQQQYEQFRDMAHLYALWNSQINVISRKDMQHFYERHVLHSLAIAKYCSFAPGARVLDIGTGGGFPALPLAVLFPEVQFYAVDSIAKKIKVLEAVQEALGLSNIFPQVARAEKLAGQYDFIISRAVTRMPKFLGWTRGKLRAGNSAGSRANGILYLKGGDLQAEMANLMNWQEQPLSDYFEESFFESKKLIYLPA